MSPAFPISHSSLSQDVSPSLTEMNQQTVLESKRILAILDDLLDDVSLLHTASTSSNQRVASGIFFSFWDVGKEAATDES